MLRFLSPVAHLFMAQTNHNLLFFEIHDTCVSACIHNASLSHALHMYMCLLGSFPSTASVVAMYETSVYTLEKKQINVRAFQVSLVLKSVVNRSWMDGNPLPFTSHFFPVHFSLVLGYSEASADLCRARGMSFDPERRRPLPGVWNRCWTHQALGHFKEVCLWG